MSDFHREEAQGLNLTKSGMTGTISDETGIGKINDLISRFRKKKVVYFVSRNI